jgi:uncharacterized protein (UPF0335 family)
MTTSISNSEDVIDSRDVIARIEELEDERQGLVDSLSDSTDDFRTAEESGDQEMIDLTLDAKDKDEAALEEWDSDNGEEYAVLTALALEAEGYAGDWKYGATLVRDDYFTEYAKQLCEDIGDVPRDLPSYIEIDWEKTADNIKVDYTAVDFDGVTYWIR